MALAADAQYFRHGPEPTSNEFAYAPTAGAVIYAGALLAITSAGTVQPIQESGSLQFVGMAAAASNTPAQPSALPYVEPMKGTYNLTVPGASFANINATVYATDDNTLTLTAASNLPVGTLVGIDGSGQTWVRLLNS